MRPLWAVVLSALCGCSVLFDPSKAPKKQCPATPDSCPALPNATATCADTTCQYSCADHFVDANGDLRNMTSDGCELDCTTGQPPSNPGALVATVGAAAGSVDWTFPSVSGAAKYTLCVAPPGGNEVCVNVDEAACDAGTCAQTTTGHADNIRVTGRVVAVDLCGREGSVTTSPSVSTTPLDTTDPSKWTHDPGCLNATYDVIGGQLSLEQQADNCSATLTAGDDQWSDFTAEGDLKFGVTGGKISGGLAIHVNGSGFRMGMLVTAEATDTLIGTALSRRATSSGSDQVVATSIHGSTASGTHLKMISHQGVVSVLEGPNAQTMSELIRFPDPLQKPGKLGIAAFGNGRVQISNFRVTTTSALPPRGPVSLLLDFADGGPPPLTRQTGNDLAYGACPQWDAGAGCDGGCVPAAGAQCAHATRMALDGTALAFDLPVGIDVRAPWSLSMKMALTPDAGSFLPQLIAGSQGALLEDGLQGWATPVSGLTVNYGKVLDLGVWHDATWRFDPDAGSFDLTLDDAKVNLPMHAFPPGNWSPHFGAFTVFGGLANNDAYVTDVRVSQP